MGYYSNISGGVGELNLSDELFQVAYTRTRVPQVINPQGKTGVQMDPISFHHGLGGVTDAFFFKSNFIHSVSFRKTEPIHHCDMQNLSSTIPINKSAGNDLWGDDPPTQPRLTWEK